MESLNNTKVQQPWEIRFIVVLGLPFMLILLMVLVLNYSLLSVERQSVVPFEVVGLLLSVVSLVGLWLMRRWAVYLAIGLLVGMTGILWIYDFFDLVPVFVWGFISFIAVSNRGEMR